MTENISLQLNSKNLTNFPDKIFQTSNLKNLFMNYNQIQLIPKSILLLSTSLRNLHLSANKISELPIEFCKLYELQTLNLSKNKISTFPEQFGELKNLKTLDLFMNNIKELPESILSLTNLYNLNLGSNKIKELPEGFQALINLAELDLSSNFLSNIFASLPKLKSLYRLLMLSNDLKVVEKENAISSESLKWIDLSYNMLEKIEFNNVPVLERLALIDNKLQVKLENKKFKIIKKNSKTYSLFIPINLEESKHCSHSFFKNHFKIKFWLNLF
jgi:internalin A